MSDDKVEEQVPPVEKEHHSAVANEEPAEPVAVAVTTSAPINDDTPEQEVPPPQHDNTVEATPAENPTSETETPTTTTSENKPNNKKNASQKNNTFNKSKMGSTRGTNASNGFQHSKVYGTHKGEITTGTHVNGQFLTTAEENERFRRQNKVATTYKGPVYVSEDTHTLCNGCGTPVDPVTRVPVGQLFFHPTCVRCNLCGKTGVAEPFYQYGYSVVCSDCVYKGHTPFVNPEEAERRGMVLGAIRGDPQKVFHQQDEQRRLMNQPNRRVHSQFGHSGAGATVNQTSVQDATPPTLTISSGLHDPRNTSTRSFQLMQRQQYYTQNDWNVRTMMPPERTRNRSSSRKSSPKPEIANKDDTLALEDRGSQPTNE